MEDEFWIPIVKDLTLDDVLKSIEETSMNKFIPFVKGAVVNRKTQVEKILKNESKILLIGEVTSLAKPTGLRYFCRFPRHVTDSYQGLSNNDVSVCFIPSSDVEIHGFALYRCYHEDIT